MRRWKIWGLGTFQTFCSTGGTAVVGLAVRVKGALAVFRFLVNGRALCAWRPTAGRRVILDVGVPHSGILVLGVLRRRTEGFKVRALERV